MLDHRAQHSSGFEPTNFQPLWYSRWPQSNKKLHHHHEVVEHWKSFLTLLWLVTIFLPELKFPPRLASKLSVSVGKSGPIENWKFRIFFGFYFRVGLSKERKMNSFWEIWKLSTLDFTCIAEWWVVENISFCSTSLPLASTRRVRSTI